MLTELHKESTVQEYRICMNDGDAMKDELHVRIEK